jgi:hypothetical protein
VSLMTRPAVEVEGGLEPCFAGRRTRAFGGMNVEIGT